MRSDAEIFQSDIHRPDPHLQDGDARGKIGKMHDRLRHLVALKRLGIAGTGPGISRSSAVYASRKGWIRAMPAALAPI